MKIASWSFSFSRTLQKIIQSFSISEQAVFWGLIALFTISMLGFASSVNNMFLTEIPAEGGSLAEGAVGVPQFINPVLANSDTDRDLTALVYSGLLRAMPSGAFIPDLASSYTVSPDGLTYTFTLRTGITWHDGKPITADDVVYTIAMVQNPQIASPHRIRWQDIKVAKVNAETVQFTLKNASMPFLENMTLGIIPKHAWESIDPERFGYSTLNVNPIGSGPYAVEGIRKDSTGIPRSYDLVPFAGFALGKPYISRVRVSFYANESDMIDALKSSEIDSANALSALSTKELDHRGYRLEKYTLPRIFAVFFNPVQNPAFSDSAVRDALSRAIDRGAIIRGVLSGYAIPIAGPVLQGQATSTGSASSLSEQAGQARAAALMMPADSAAANAELDKALWVRGPDGIRQKKIGKNTVRLAFSISTSDSQELTDTAAMLKKSWEKIGAHVDVKIFKTSDLSEMVIRPRAYDALFFGEIVGHESDLFAFWHSSQRTDPGLNIAGYNSRAADKLLEAARIEQDPAVRANEYQQFEKIIEKDAPAAFVYSPNFIYIVPHDLKGLTAGSLTVPSERLNTIYLWYRESEKVWKLFLPKNH